MSSAFNWISLIKSFASNAQENEIVEFKENNADPEMIGKDISALSNMAALLEKERAYLIWGVRDSDHELVGTTFSPNKTKVGNEEIQNWLSTQLEPSIYICFHAVEIDDKNFVVLEIEKARNFLTRFKKNAYCRINSYTKLLNSSPIIEKKIWEKLNDAVPEERIVLSDLSQDELSQYLSFEAYFNALGAPIPSSRDEMIKRLINERFLKKLDDGTYGITYLGALLIAKDFSLLPSLGRKQITVTLFDGESKIQNRASEEFNQGYLMSFEQAISYIKTLTLLKTSVNAQGYTVSNYAFPEIAIREGLTNCIIHQELLERGAGPMVNITNDSIEFNNPGELKIDVDHLIDAEPMSENELLASFLRRVGIGDSRGTGFDKMEAALEEQGMLSLNVRQTPNHVSTMLYAYKPFGKWTIEEKLNAIYMHACLRYYSMGKNLTNESLRERFQLSDKDKYTISRLIKVAVERGRIKMLDPNASDKNRSYIPYWA